MTISTMSLDVSNKNTANLFAGLVANSVPADAAREMARYAIAASIMMAEAHNMGIAMTDANMDRIALAASQIVGR